MEYSSERANYLAITEWIKEKPQVLDQYSIPEAYWGGILCLAKQAIHAQL